MEKILDFIWSDIKDNLLIKMHGSLKITYQMDLYIYATIEYPREIEKKKFTTWHKGEFNFLKSHFKGRESQPATESKLPEK